MVGEEGRRAVCVRMVMGRLGRVWSWRWWRCWFGLVVCGGDGGGGGVCVCVCVRGVADVWRVSGVLCGLGCWCGVSVGWVAMWFA